MSATKGRVILSESDVQDIFEEKLKQYRQRLEEEILYQNNEHEIRVMAEKLASQQHQRCYSEIRARDQTIEEQSFVISHLKQEIKDLKVKDPTEGRTPDAKSFVEKI